jgi:acyl-CoA synthetase (NDP forming)
MMNARSIAVVGASADTSKFGGMTMETLIGGGYDGAIYPVNPKGGELFGLTVYASLEDIPGEVDGVLIIIPARFVAGVIEQAADKGAKAVAILSAGFREAGRQDLEDEILETARCKGVRLLGPNIQGITNLSNQMCASFTPIFRHKGPLTVITHSGSITASMAEWSQRDGLGLCAAVNLGNQVDLSEADYIDYFSRDSDTGVIACYLEGIKDGNRFLSVIEDAARRKPVVALKTGRTESGAKAAASHTGSLAGSHDVFTGICRQHGVVVANETIDLYDMAKGLALIKTRGNRVAIITSSGGSAALALDEMESSGLELAPISPLVREALQNLGLPPLAKFSNPIDCPLLTAAPYLEIARVLDQHDVADTILFSFADPVAGADADWARGVKDLRSAVAVCFMGGGMYELESTPVLIENGLAVFPSPERCIRGIAASAWRAKYLQSRDLEVTHD